MRLVLPPVWMTASYSCSASGLLCWGWFEAIALTGAILTVYLILFIKVLVPETIAEDTTFWLMIMDNKMILQASVSNDVAPRAGRT